MTRLDESRAPVGATMERTLRVILAINIATLALACGAFGLAAYAVATGPATAQEAADSVIGQLPLAGSGATAGDVQSLLGAQTARIVSVLSTLRGCGPSAGAPGFGGPAGCDGADIASVADKIDELSRTFGGFRGWPRDIYDSLEGLRSSVDDVQLSVEAMCAAMPGC